MADRRVLDGRIERVRTIFVRTLSMLVEEDKTNTHTKLKCAYTPEMVEITRFELVACTLRTYRSTN